MHTGISYQQHKGPESSCCASEGRHPWYPQFESLEVCWKAQSSRMRMESGEWLKQWPQTTLWKNGAKYCSKYLQFFLFLRKLPPVIKLLHCSINIFSEDHIFFQRQCTFIPVLRYSAFSFLLPISFYSCIVLFIKSETIGDAYANISNGHLPNWKLSWH